MAFRISASDGLGFVRLAQPTAPSRDNINNDVLAAVRHDEGERLLERIMTFLDSQALIHQTSARR